MASGGKKAAAWNLGMNIACCYFNRKEERKKKNTHITIFIKAPHC